MSPWPKNRLRWANTSKPQWNRGSHHGSNHSILQPRIAKQNCTSQSRISLTHLEFKFRVKKTRPCADQRRRVQAAAVAQIRFPNPCPRCIACETKIARLHWRNNSTALKNRCLANRSGYARAAPTTLQQSAVCLSVFLHFSAVCISALFHCSCASFLFFLQFSTISFPSRFQFSAFSVVFCFLFLVLPQLFRFAFPALSLPLVVCSFTCVLSLLFRLQLSSVSFLPSFVFGFFNCFVSSLFCLHSSAVFTFPLFLLLFCNFSSVFISLLPARFCCLHFWVFNHFQKFPNAEVSFQNFLWYFPHLTSFMVPVINCGLPPSCWRGSR